jgi:hypothetical protein
MPPTPPASHLNTLSRRYTSSSSITGWVTAWIVFVIIIMFASCIANAAKKNRTRTAAVAAATGHQQTQSHTVNVYANGTPEVTGDDGHVNWLAEQQRAMEGYTAKLQKPPPAYTVR